MGLCQLARLVAPGKTVDAFSAAGRFDRSGVEVYVVANSRCGLRGGGRCGLGAVVVAVSVYGGRAWSLSVLSGGGSRAGGGARDRVHRYFREKDDGLSARTPATWGLRQSRQKTEKIVRYACGKMQRRRPPAPRQPWRRGSCARLSVLQIPFSEKSHVEIA